jgi:hypothetical protein
MYPQILGVSGSPIKDSNTDRLIQAVLQASGLPAEFVKLSRLQVRPCIACLGCKENNVCQVKDDFPELAEKCAGQEPSWLAGTLLTVPWTASLKPSWNASFPCAINMA